MDNHDILFVIFDILAEREDAQALINCSSVNKLMNRVFNAYKGNKYARLPSVQICKLANSPMAAFKTQLLSILLVDTQINSMIGDTWSLVKYLRLDNPSVTMGTCLDRLIPDNTPSGNDMDYKPGVILSDLIVTFSYWLNTLPVAKTDFCFGEDMLDEDAVDVPVDTWYALELALDEFYRLLFKFKSSRMTAIEKNDWGVTYDNYSLYSTQNIANTEKMTLYLNKLKTIYQMSN
jgi:hypothetical protein